MNVLVSVALCTYNGEKFIEEQLDSLISQSYSNLEIIIVDDASTDNTFSILEGYKNNDSRIKLYRNEQNIGLQANFEKALKLCLGTYICISDQDDIWNKNKITSLISKIGTNLLVYHDSSYITDVGTPTGKSIRTLHRFVSGERTKNLLYQNCVSGHAMLFSKELLSMLPPFVEPVYYDWWLSYTAACTGKLNYTNEILVKYRIHSGSVIRRDKDLSSGKRLSVLECFLKHPLTPTKTRDLIYELRAGYKLKEKDKFSWKLFFTLLQNKKSLFYIRKKSLLSQYKFIINECRPEAHYPQKKNPGFSPKTILLIDSHLPYYDKESGSNRIYHIIKIFRSLSVHIIFVPADGLATEPYHTELINSGIEIIIRSGRERDFLRKINAAAKRSDAAWVCRPEFNAQFSKLFKRNPHLKWIYDTVDLHYIRLERGVKLFPEDKKMAKRAAAYRVTELNLARSADITVCITPNEQEELTKQGIDNTIVIPNIHNPKAVETVPFKKRQGLVFIGSYLHHPNIDAAEWLCKEIMPLVWKSSPEIKLTMLGDQPGEITKFQSERILIPGYVHDISPYFNNARIFVAPLRYGAGMKGKIGQSLEYSLPIITSDIGAEGMNLRHEQHVLIANDTSSFAEQIIRLYHDESLWHRLHFNSLEAIKPFTSEAILQTIKEIKL